ncbi:MAG: LEA type 2 family protein [Bdellovibrionia bacterium]
MKHILLILAIFTSVGCASVLKEPTAQIKDVEVSKLTLDGGELKLICEVENPNGVDLTIDSLNYTLSLNNRTITSTEISDKTNLPARGKTTVALPIQFKYTDVFSSLSDLLTQKPVSYSVQGNAKMGIFNLPFKKQGEVNIKK